MKARREKERRRKTDKNRQETVARKGGRREGTEPQRPLHENPPFSKKREKNEKPLLGADGKELDVVVSSQTDSF